MTKRIKKWGQVHFSNIFRAVFEQKMYLTPFSENVPDPFLKELEYA